MKIIQWMISIPMTLVLLLLVAVSVGTATFIEASHGPETARALVYDSRWLEILYALLAFNLTGNIIRFRLWRKGKRLTGLFHFSFLIILGGAALTRYAGHGYTFLFREGETTGRVLSDRAYLNLRINQEPPAQEKIYAFPLRLSSIGRNRWRKSLSTGSGSLKIKLDRYLPEAVPEAVEDPTGNPVLTLSVTNGDEPLTLLLRSGEKDTYGDVTFHFTADKERLSESIQFYTENNQLYCISASDMAVISMTRSSQTVIEAGTPVTIEPGTLFKQGSIRFALRSWMPKARFIARAPEGSSMEEPAAAIVLSFLKGAETREITLFGGPGAEGDPEALQFNDTQVTAAYGALPSELPFRLRLEDFIIRRYPGSRMPSAYESRVTLIDTSQGVERPFLIYMNHILKYRGYRFYQDSYDEDEKGSILTVTRDPGTPVTYAGYGLLISGLILGLFNPKSRFRVLGRQIGTAGIILLFMCGTGSLMAQNSPSRPLSIDKHHAARFARLIVQDQRGRMKPVHTLSRDLLSTLDHPEKNLNLNPDEWALLMFISPEQAGELPLIPVEDPDIRVRLGLDPDLKFVSLSALYDPASGAGRLDGMAMTSPGASFSSLDKSVAKTRKASLLCEQIRSGSLFRLFPDSSLTDRWVTEGEVLSGSALQRQIEEYKASVLSGEWKEADVLLCAFRTHQIRNSPKLVPSSFRRETEILYNRLQIFRRSGPCLAIAGILIVILYLFAPASSASWKKRVGNFLVFLAWIGFGFLGVGMIMRWIASGHAPWTNKYESMIYIAWAVLASAFLLSRSCRLVLGGAVLISGIILTAVHSGWADPQIGNLVPVLKSHWLITHVSVITASYGFFSLSAVTGFLTLLFITLHGQKEASENPVRLLTVINERSMIVGLTLVMAGNLLGAVWANESWGRYWGWDPKETWTLIIILAYSVILHSRWVPRFSWFWCLHAGSMAAYWTVIMTYFGVNVYLSGMHSYAGGEPARFPWAAIWIFLFQAGLSVWVFVRKK